MTTKKSFWQGVEWILAPARLILNKLLNYRSIFILKSKKLDAQNKQTLIKSLIPSTEKSQIALVPGENTDNLLSRTLSEKTQQGATNLEDKEASENAGQLSNKQWGSFSESPDLQIHFGLFQKGIIAVKPSFTSTPAKNLPSDDTQFHLNSRELIFGNSATTNSKKPIKLLNILGAFHDQPRLSNESQNVLIYNKTRRDEIFIPIVVEDEHKKKLGFYVYPWLSSNKDNFEFLGFKQFVIAGCIFGSSLKAIDDNNGTFALIKHDIKLYEKQKIVDIEVNLQEFSSYEKMLFSEFEKLMLLMKKFGKKHEEIELYYHLPYYDYILFGVELFVRGRITFPALDLFFNVIFLRKAQHEREIHRICKIHNILVRIESPFENIFGALPPNTTECAKFIFDKLRLSNVENKPELDEKLQKENEDLRRELLEKN